MDILTDALWLWLNNHVGKQNLWIIAVFFIVVAFAYRAWRSRIHRGEYVINTKDSYFIFESEIGKFEFNKEKKIFKANYINKKEVVLSFEDIRNVEVITEEIDAMLSEIAFEGWDILIDTMPKYRDVVKKYSIAVVTKNFQRYPLIVMSQYTIKDFLAWGLQMQLDLLSMIGLYVPIDMYTEDIYKKFRAALGDHFELDKNRLNKF